MAKVAFTGFDLIKGKTTSKQPWFTNLIDMSPWQMIPEEEKGQEWIMWNMDWFEQVGYNQVLKHNRPIIKNRRLAAGILDAEDYLLSPDVNPQFTGLLSQMPHMEEHNLLQQYMPVIPNVISTLIGEHLQRDNRMIVRGIDDFTLQERLEHKEELFTEVLVQQALQEKQLALMQMGIFPDDDNPEMTQQYMEQMQQAQQFAEVENKSRKFVTTAEIYGQHIIDSAKDRFNMVELEKDNFRESLTNSREYWHIDMKEDHFTVETIDSAYYFGHHNPTKKYASEGDFSGWFTWMTIGDIIDKFGEKMSDEQLLSLKDIMTQFTGLAIIPNSQKGFPGSYYDTSKPYPMGKTDPSLNDALVQQNLLWNYSGYSTNTGVTGLSASQMFNQSNQGYGEPHLFRVMRLYWKSQRKMGFLTKIDRDGSIAFQDWVDENFTVTVPPVYDTSLVKGKKVENLLYGEHIEWTWVNEWRHGIKIAPNANHQFWRTYPQFNNIYLDGEAVKFQFKGKNDVYDALPPIEGCEYRTVGVRPVSIVDRMKPWQILANVAGNKVTEIMSDDLGLLISVNKALIPRNTGNEEADYGDPLTQYFENLRRSRIVDYSTSKEHVEGYGGQVVPPQVVDASRISEAQQYYNLFREFKIEAMEAVGITRERSAQAKATQTATSVEQGVQFSESQTLELYHQHDLTMERVYQRILEAAQFYDSKKQSATVSYLNTKEENIMLEVAGGELFRHYNIKVQSSPRLKMLEAQFKQILLTDNTLGANTLEKAEALFAGSSVEILEKMKAINERTMAQEQEKYTQQQQLQAQQLEAAQQLEQMKIENENMQKELDRQSQERVATIRALGGIQTDVDVNQVPDAQQNMEFYLKNQQLQNQNTQQQEQMNLQKQQHIDNMLIEREKTNAKLKETKMKTDAQKYVAVKNKNKYG